MSQALATITQSRRESRRHSTPLTRRQVRNLEGAVLAVWAGGSDTVDIATRFALSEAEVYRITSSRPPKPQPRNRIPYAGKH